MEEQGINGLGIPVFRLAGAGGYGSNPNGVGHNVGVEYRQDLGRTIHKNHPQHQTPQNTKMVAKVAKCNCNDRKPQNHKEAMGTLMAEMYGLDGALNGLGACGDFAKLRDYHDQFMLRLKAHLINSYNWLNTMASKGYVAAPLAQQYMQAYHAVIEGWNDDTAREAALTNLEQLQNDAETAKEVARAICLDMGIEKAQLIEVNRAQPNPGPGVGMLDNLNIPNYTTRQDVTVLNGLGQMYEASTTRMDGFSGQIRGSVIDTIELAGLGAATRGGFAAFDAPEYVGNLGEYENEGTHYILQGIDGLGKPLTFKIKPKNIGKELKKATNAVKNAVQHATTKAAADIKRDAKKVGAAVKTTAEKTKAVVQKAGADAKKLAAKAWQATKKVNPITAVPRWGILLAANMNIGKMAERLKWGYANADQAKRAKLTPAQHAAAKAGLAKTETLFVKKLGGSANALRKAVLSAKKGHLNGLGALAGPEVVAAIIAAIPFILEILKILKGSPVQKADGTMGTEDTPFDPTKPLDNVPTDEQNNAANNLPDINSGDQPQGGGSAPSPAGPVINITTDNSTDGDIQKSTNPAYQPVYTNKPAGADTEIPDGNADPQRTGDDHTDVNPDGKTPAASGDGATGKSSNGLLFGGLALGGLLLVVANKPKKSMAGIDPVVID